MTGLRIGHGFDVHTLVPGRPLWLGGVKIPHERGLAGHSDGDVLLHAVASALLGALGEGDLGTHFPSSDPALEGEASGALLGRVLELTAARGLAVGHLDSTVVAQEPRLAPHQGRMRAALAERLGAIGRGEGIAATAVVLLEPSP